MEKYEIRNMVRGGQITLPKWFREKYHLNPGDPIEFIEEEQGIIIQPLARSAKENPAAKLIKFLDQAKDYEKTTSEDDLLKTTEKEIKKVRSSNEISH